MARGEVMRKSIVIIALIVGAFSLAACSEPSPGPKGGPKGEAGPAGPQGPVNADLIFPKSAEVKFPSLAGMVINR
jgi:hypothetical protein